MSVTRPTVRRVEQRRLGRTEHRSSVAILGGAAFWATESAEDARPVFELALDAGVNHLDIAPQYGNAERVVGPLVPAVRDRLFVAGKTLRSNPDGSRRSSMTPAGCSAARCSTSTRPTA